jgi:alkanesulfonate monooxygenase SsuD/methylene tetrahydromethanopterin reductase-like flavin-dependent oxidoreductase (luciferase family)
MDMARPAMFLEAINQVLEIWASKPPYNIKGTYWNVSTERTFLPETGMGTIPQPLQRPHPPVVVTAVAPFSQGITEAAARGWDPISANFLLPKWVASHWGKYVEGCTRVNRRADPANWRVAKTVFVAKDDASASAYALGSDGPYYYYYRTLFMKLKRRGALGVFKSDPKAPDDSVTLEDVINKLVIHGSPAKVADHLMALQEETGKFGTLLYAGVDWTDPALARQSMVLMAEQVMPRLRVSP